MAKLKKGQKLICVPCGREVIISSAGISTATIWCCGAPMKRGASAKKTARKAVKPRRVAKKTARKKKSSSKRK